MLGNLVLDQRLRSRGLRSLARRGARERLGSSANLTSMVGSHSLTSNLQVFVVGYGDVSARAAICAIWENGLDLFV